jgi:triosephosphate isomerase
MSNNWLYIANWKSYLSYQQELAWFQQNSTELKQLTLDLNTQNKKLIICPSFMTLTQASELLSSEILKSAQDKSIQLGAQNCSSYQFGAYTGEIPAESLKELACGYCLVGHFERRQLFHETDLEILAKIKLLIQAQITPIICISETQQLINILDNLDLELSDLQIMVAYEPTWAIGTGKTPTSNEISQFCQQVHAIIATRSINLKNYLIIYGGSVTANNIAELRQIPELNGVLVGKASINFQELKKIVLS